MRRKNNKKRYRIYIYYLSLIFLFNTCNSSDKVSIALLELVDADYTGIVFRNDIVEDLGINVFTYTNLYNGGGVTAGDVNNDGLVDLYFSSNTNTGKLYLNKGDFKFNDITLGSGLDTLSGWKTGVTMVDINQDGFLDIYICRSGRTRPKFRSNLLFVNNGDLTFTEKGKEYGLDDWGTSNQATFFDYDLDGDLDMYLLNHAIDPVRTIFKNFHDKDINRNTGDKLFNNKNGHFTEVKEFIGINRSKLGDGLGVAVFDLNNDRYPDIYICNDFAGRDYLYINKGDGTFEEVALKAMNHMTISSMGVDMADIDNDGWLDIFVLDMLSSTNYGRKTNMSGMDADVFDILVKLGGHRQYMVNTLQLNNGNQTFSDIAPMAGVTNTDWSWGPLIVDLDNDGLKDIFVANGMKNNTNNIDYDNFKNIITQQEFKGTEKDFNDLALDLISKIPEEKVVNHVYKNIDGLTFKQTNNQWGVNLPSFSNGAAYADLDNDGDMDLVINNVNEEAHIYRNNATDITGNHFLRIKLNGSKTNLNGIGAKIMVQAGANRQYLEQQVTRGYLSSISYNLHFGLGQSGVVDILKVTWPDGKVSELKNIAADQLIAVDYTSAVDPTDAEAKKPLLFSDVTNAYGLNHKHIENEYDDYKREVLLPHKMSTFGPALAVSDVNYDGLDDFFIGGAMGYEGTIYVQNPNTSFTLLEQADILADKDFEDMDAIFFDSDGDGDQDLYVVSGGIEHTAKSPFYQDRLYLNNGKGKFTKSQSALPEFFTSGGAVRANDFDADGDMDLFVGGRVIPGSYPLPPRSYLLENNGGVFSDITSAVARDLMNPGLVTDALWTDFNADGIHDLIVIGEWMPLAFFQNMNGKLEKIDSDSTLENSNGWWFSISEADVDDDGDLDYILGNLGENYKYKATTNFPFKLFSNDFDNNGHLDIVLAYYEDSTLYPLRGRDCTIQQIPALENKFEDYHSFGLATLEDVYGASYLEASYKLEAKTFSNSILLNTDAGFELRVLPKMAQISSVFGSVYKDFDNDGMKDIVIAGNFYNSEIKTMRNDAGQGLFLRGKGNGEFTPVRGYDSGLYIPGDVKKLKSIRLGKGSSARQGVIAGINNDFLKLISVQ